MARSKRKFDGKKVDVAGIIYDINYKDLNKKIKSKDKIGVSGLIDLDSRVIYIDSDIPESEEYVAIIHELCHATLEAIIPTKILLHYEEIEEIIMAPFARILTGAMRSLGLLK